MATYHNPSNGAATGTERADYYLLHNGRSVGRAGAIDAKGGFDALVFAGNTALSDADFGALRGFEGMQLNGTSLQKVVLGPQAAAAFTGGVVQIQALKASKLVVDGSAMSAGSTLRVQAGAGTDRLVGGAGNDEMDGGAGDDSLTGGAGNDTLQGGDGDDVLNGDAGNDILRGDAGNDRLFGGDGDDRLHGGLGDDLIEGGDGADTLYGDAGNDRLLGGLGDDVAWGGAGDDVLFGGAGRDVLYGGDGADQLRGDEGDDVLDGGAGNDRLNGGAGADTLLGGAGDDDYAVDNAGDVVIEAAGGGSDTVYASVSWTLGAEIENLVLSGAATLGRGNELANRLTAGDNGATLLGLDGRDTLVGGDGADTLSGGAGADRLTGGAGADTFLYANAAEGGDTVVDFLSGTDRIAVSAAGFGGGLAEGMDLLATGRFVSNTTGQASAPSGTGQFVYETDAARLWWDADGSGGAAAVRVATLSAGTALAASDILLLG